MVFTGRIVDAKYGLKNIKPNRASTVLYLDVERENGTLETFEYLVGYNEYWRPNELLNYLERTLPLDSHFTPSSGFKVLIEYLRDYCGFDWERYTLTGKRGKVAPCYPVNVLKGMKFKWDSYIGYQWCYVPVERVEG